MKTFTHLKHTVIIFSLNLDYTGLKEVVITNHHAFFIQTIYTK